MPEIKKEEKKITHANIHEALSAFQGELKPMEKNGEVEFPTNKGGVVKFKYTPLGDIMKNIYPLLAKHGLAVRHEITEKGVDAILTHGTYEVVIGREKVTIQEIGNVRDSKELVSMNVTEKEVVRSKNEIRSGIVEISKGGDMKDKGAAITYARRYTLTMVLGISSEDDKDADLLQQSAKNAINYAYTRADKNIDEAKTEAELDKAVKVLSRDLDLLEKGKAPALGLSKEQYEMLIKKADDRKKGIKDGVDEPSKDEEAVKI